jgi:predicted transposase YbfD/YdcC
MDYTQLKPNQRETEEELVYDLNSIYDFLSKIEDPRSKFGKQYPLTLLLIWILLAKLAGQDRPSGIAEWVAHRTDLWVEYHLTKKHKAPSHMTYRRLLQDILSVEALEALLVQYHRLQLTEGQKIVLSMDGKTVRGTIPAGECRGTHLLAIYVPQQGLVLAQIVVDRKENEIVVAPQVLSQVSLAGRTVIADAMHTQKGLCRQVIDADGDYVLTAKENQARTRWAIEKLFIPEACNLQKGAALSKGFRMAVQVKKGHGRIEKRTILTSTELNEYLEDWPGLAQVFRVETIVWCAALHTRHIRYGFTSLCPHQAGPERILELLCAYWGIESGLHYRRDVTLLEDATRLTVGDAGQVMAILNNLVIGFCLSQQKNVASARRWFDAQPKRALDLLLSANPKSL